MDTLHIVWILIAIIAFLICIDLFKRDPSAVIQPIRRPEVVIQSQSILKPKEIIKEREWERDVRVNKSVRFSFSNDDEDVKRDQKGTQELDEMYVPAREEVPVDDPFKCKAQSTSLPFANVNTECLVAYNIKTTDVKEEILESLNKRFNVKIIQKHYYRLTEESIKHINATPHLVSLRTNGNPYFMYLTTYEDKEIVYFIDKKVHPTYQLPRMIISKGLFKKSLFKGTLLDGEMVKCKDNTWTFLICDMVAYEGEHLTKILLPDRLKMIYNLLEKQYTPDSTIDMCKFRVKQYANLCVETVEKIAKEEVPFTIRGIYFWAYNLKYKPKLLNFDESVIKDVHIKVKDTPEFMIKDIVRVMNLAKTDTPDIYKIYSAENPNETHGIACIQDIKTSHLVREAFKDTSANTVVRFRCKLNTQWNKWQPLEIA
eukprot:768660-Hanusia_phi.AAC.1